MKKQTTIILAIIIYLLSACSPNADPHTDPQKIIDEAIATHGGKVYRNSIIEYDYRGKHMLIRQNQGRFSIERTYDDSSGSVLDVLNNDSIFRRVNDKEVSLTEKEIASLHSSLNSGVYFSFLPFSLNDPAVIKRYAGQATILGQPYHKIEVTFQEEGGGVDFDDRFVYWIHKENKTMDYFAYYFHVDGGGSRFRQAINVRQIGGIRFADYVNFISDKINSQIEDYDRLFENNELKVLSQIILENIKVHPLD